MQILPLRSTAIVLCALFSLTTGCILTDDFREAGTQSDVIEADASGDTDAKADASRSVREIIESGIVDERWVGAYTVGSVPHVAAIVVAEFDSDGTMTATHTGAYVGEWSVGEDFKIEVSNIEPAPDSPSGSSDDYTETLTISPVVNSDDELEALELDINFAGTSVSQTVTYQRASDATVLLSDLQGLWKGNNTPTLTEPVIGLRVNATTKESELVVFGAGDGTTNVLSGRGFVFRANGDDYWGMLPEGVNADGEPHSAIGGVVDSSGAERRIWLPVITTVGGGGIRGETDALKIQ